LPYEIDFLPVGTNASSGDAIALRYGNNASGYTIHIVDGGYADTASGLIEHVRSGYQSGTVAHVVLTHADGDHAAGLVEVMETLQVQALWMNRPWLYAAEIIHHFHGNWTVAGLIQHLREQYPTLVKLEAIASRRGIPVYEAFQGTQIGQFTVLAPSRARYLRLLPNFDKTPERKTTADNTGGPFTRLAEIAVEAARAIVRWTTESWLGETLSEHPEPTSASNESSLVQMAVIDGYQLVLTGDVGPEGLHEAAHYAELCYGTLAPRFMQIPHHGSRRNVTPSALNRWLGPVKAPRSAPIGYAYCSAARLDEDHPRKKVVNAFNRRGYEVHITNGRQIYHQFAMLRTGAPLTPEPFSTQVEE
jgi:beta-lactamase superfamily II metal-dependent hydrolase